MNRQDRRWLMRLLKSQNSTELAQIFEEGVRLRWIIE